MDESRYAELAALVGERVAEKEIAVRMGMSLRTVQRCKQDVKAYTYSKCSDAELDLLVVRAGPFGECCLSKKKIMQLTFEPVHPDGRSGPYGTACRAQRYISIRPVARGLCRRGTSPPDTKTPISS